MAKLIFFFSFRLLRYLAMNMNLQRETYYMQKELLKEMVWLS